MEVIGEAVDGGEAIVRAGDLRPDVVVMDITMAGVGGLAATREIRERYGESKVLVLTVHNNVEYLRQALDAGATGYVLKQAADTELAVAIRAVQRGEVFVYPVFTRVLLGGWAQDGEADASSQPDSYELLSPREKQVLRLVALGFTSRQIAEQLYLSIKTVGTYRARLMAKLDLKSRPALVRYAIKKGLLENHQPGSREERAAGSRGR
jgi:two-component system response regulator NreC